MKSATLCLVGIELMVQFGGMESMWNQWWFLYLQVVIDSRSHIRVNKNAASVEVK